MTFRFHFTTFLRAPLACVLMAGMGHSVAEGAIEAFPTAQGFGRFSVGGRGGVVHHVTNLADSGPGSLRAAVESAGARTVVFRVDGTIRLLSPLRVRNSYLTIAGQTAPGEGICLSGYGLIIEANHVIVRYLRVRPGDIAQADVDGIHVMSGTDIMLDHCSVSWGVDETLSVTPDPTRVSVQWCLIAESLNQSVHSSGNAHGKGSLIRGRNGARYSFHHNLFAHHVDRVPQINGMDSASVDPDGVMLDFRNNVIYNWGDVADSYEAAGANRNSDAVAKYNFIGNQYLVGPDTLPGFLPVPQFPGYALRYWIFEELCPHASAHFGQNALNGTVWADPWTPVSSAHASASYKQSLPLAIPGGEILTDTADLATVKVLAKAGASWRRDTADLRVVEGVRNGTGYMIDSQSEVGGWPALQSGVAPLDSDADGVPDSIELSWGLNPFSAADRNFDRDGDGRTNLEEWLNQVDLPVFYPVTVTQQGSGNVSPLGEQLVPEFSTVTVSASPATYWELDEVFLDSQPSSLMAVNNLGPVTEPHQVHLTFKPMVTVEHGTPLEWLTGHGLSLDTADPNGNGLRAWQEYRVGLSPHSSRQLVSINDVENAVPLLRFIQPEPTRAGAASILQKSDNLRDWDDATYEILSSQTVEEGAQELLVRVTNAAPGACFFRVKFDFD